MSELKVGNRVKVVGSSHAYTRNFGRVGTIVEIAGHIHRVNFDNDPDGKGTYDTAYASDLELLPTTTGTVKDKLDQIATLVAEIKTLIGQ